MPLESGKVQSLIAKVPEGKWLKLSSSAIEEWLHFVADANEPISHDEVFYASVARVMSEQMGSAAPSDFADPQMRTFIIEGSQSNGPAGSVERGTGTSPEHLAKAIEALAKATQERDQPKKEYLSFNLKQRLDELGLGNLPKNMMPSEEAMIRLEKASKVARDQGRLYIGSAEGEDLQVSFRPPWSRTPKIDVTVGDGSFEEKLRSAVEAKKTRSLEDRTTFVGFATFYGHILDWGVKMVFTKAITSTQLLAYQIVLTRVAEEYGGFRVCTHYDLLLRQKLARELERDERSQIETLLCTLDRDVLADAKNSAEKRVKETAKAATKTGQASGSQPSRPAPASSKGGGKGPSKGGKLPAQHPKGRQVHSPVRSRSPKRNGDWYAKKWDNTKKGDKKW
ncbi:unnamed protein product [Prorocentrum cordatum]|uniref:Uncharacterized protein n=1 Tax=Prorocentrum cordatum TaxID=2364126 RepID=A0ABN9RUS2_9DINO|nr:unnamed protein product [Polarella glacialis]